MNTQKLGKSSNLTKHGDGRTYTIWETLRNTVREKSDLDRQFRLADIKLVNEGIGYKYGCAYQEADNPNGFKIDIILYAADSDCIAALNAYAKDRFHDLNDTYRRRTINLPISFKKKYNDIV